MPRLRSHSISNTTLSNHNRTDSGNLHVKCTAAATRSRTLRSIDSGHKLADASKSADSTKGFSKPSVLTTKNTLKVTEHVTKISDNPRRITRKASHGTLKSATGSGVESKQFTEKVKKEKRKKQPKPADPYLFDEVAEADDDEKENIDPFKPKTPRQKSKTPKRFSMNSFRHSFISPLSTCKGLATDVKRQQQLSATIRLPLPLAKQSTPLTGTPLIPNILPPAASTPAVQARAEVSAPVVSAAVASPVPNEDLSPPPEPLVPRRSSISVEPFTDDPIRSRSASIGSSKDDSRHSKSATGSRKMDHSEQEDAYSSWLEEFNAQLENFSSHELTIEDD